MLNHVLHQLVVNSMTTIQVTLQFPPCRILTNQFQDSITQRLAGAEEAKQKAKAAKKKKVQGKGQGDTSGAATGPPALFITEVVLEYHQMSFSPNKSDFENGMEKVNTHTAQTQQYSF